MSDDLRCTNCGEYAGSPIADRIEELEVKLAKAGKVLEWVKFGGGPRCESCHELACQALAELKDEKERIGG